MNVLIHMIKANILSLLDFIVSTCRNLYSILSFFGNQECDAAQLDFQNCCLQNSYPCLCAFIMSIKSPYDLNMESDYFNKYGR